MSDPLDLIPGELTLPVLRRVARGRVNINLDPPAYDKIAAAKDVVDQIVKKGEVVYAVNTGFGLLANKQVPLDKLEMLQENLVLSHATGTGPNLPDSVVRMVLVTKIGALAQGYSGVREDVVDALIALVNHDVLPCIPAKGSVGASGDLAPLAHMTAVLLGHGTARIDGKEVPAAEALKHAGLEPIRLGPKEGLALLNGTQVSCALALEALFRIEDVFSAALVAGAMSVEAAKGSAVPFKPGIHEVRGQKGQIDTAAIYRELLKKSGIMESHVDCGKVQDPYSLRCQPQVMGACLDHMRFAADILLREANAVTDNPLVFPDGAVALSGGNFHAEYVAMAADVLALVIAETGALSERRIAMLIDSNISGLPPFLVADAGVNSGFMIAHVTAAALASENKQKSHPACVDSLPTSANQEDHVSMATHGARRLLDMADNTATIVGIELLAAAQGMDFHEGLKSSPVLEKARALIRNVADHWDKDRLFAPDIAAAKTLVGDGAFYPLIDARLVTPGE